MFPYIQKGACTKGKDKTFVEFLYPIKRTPFSSWAPFITGDFR